MTDSRECEAYVMICEYHSNLCDVVLWQFEAFINYHTHCVEHRFLDRDKLSVYTYFSHCNGANTMYLPSQISIRYTNGSLQDVETRVLMACSYYSERICACHIVYNVFDYLNSQNS